MWGVPLCIDRAGNITVYQEGSIREASLSKLESEGIMLGVQATFGGIVERLTGLVAFSEPEALSLFFQDLGNVTFGLSVYTYNKATSAYEAFQVAVNQGLSNAASSGDLRKVPLTGDEYETLWINGF